MEGRKKLSYICIIWVDLLMRYCSKNTYKQNKVKAGQDKGAKNLVPQEQPSANDGQSLLTPFPETPFQINCLQSHVCLGVDSWGVWDLP